MMMMEGTWHPHETCVKVKQCRDGSMSIRRYDKMFIYIYVDVLMGQRYLWWRSFYFVVRDLLGFEGERGVVLCLSFLPSKF